MSTSHRLVGIKNPVELYELALPTDGFSPPNETERLLGLRYNSSDPDARHVHVGFELGQRATFTLEEKIEQEAARLVGKRLEHEVVVHTR